MMTEWMMMNRSNSFHLYRPVFFWREIKNSLNMTWLAHNKIWMNWPHKNDTESTTILFRFCFEYTNQLTDRQTRKQTRTLTLFHSKVDYLITYVIYTKGFVCFIVEVFIVIFVVIYNITIWNRIIQSWENTISSHDYKHNHHHHDRDDCKIVSDKIKKRYEMSIVTIVNDISICMNWNC